MIRYVLLTFLFLSLHAQDDFDLYIEEGITAVLKKWDTQLETQSFWDEKLKERDLQFGYLENSPEIFFCDKNSSTLAHYALDENNTYQQLDIYPALTGKRSGDKQVAGDLKTPIGIYTITRKLKNVDQFYGPFAYVTSYPNFFDRIRKKSGSGIWIHGLPITGDRDNVTKGCIAINNDDLENLSDNSIIKNSKLIIKSNAKNDINSSHITSLMAQLYQWKNAWRDNNFTKYIQFYSYDFKRYDHKNYEDFSAMKAYIFALKDIKTIHLYDINIMPYPDTNSTYEITFKENYHSARTTFNGQKILIVRLDDNQSMKILAEQ